MSLTDDELDNVVETLAQYDWFLEQKTKRMVGSEAVAYASGMRVAFEWARGVIRNEMVKSVRGTGKRSVRDPCKKCGYAGYKKARLE